MEDKERIEATDEEVEGHGKKRLSVKQHEEAEQDEVEGHATFGKRPVAASDEPKGEGEDDDDVEGHALRHRPVS